MVLILSFFLCQSFNLEMFLDIPTFQVYQEDKLVALIHIKYCALAFLLTLSVIPGRTTYWSLFSSWVGLEHCSNQLFPRSIPALSSERSVLWLLFIHIQSPCLPQPSVLLCWNFESWFWSHVISAVLVESCHFAHFLNISNASCWLKNSIE